MTHNEYKPFLAEIKDVIKHTDREYTFRLTYEGAVKPGQFFEVSIPKYGEAPMSVCGINDGTVDLTIRRVGKVTNEIFAYRAGDRLFLRGPYGNGFDVESYKNKELVIVAGGTGFSPVRGVVDYFTRHTQDIKGLTLIVGFKTPADILFREDFAGWKDKMQLILTVDRAEEGSSYQVGLVTDYIPKLSLKNAVTAEAIVVGPPVMIHFTTMALLKAGFREENIWVSMERKMCCGIGKCGHCKVNDTYICLDGPVFNFTKSRELID